MKKLGSFADPYCSLSSRKGMDSFKQRLGPGHANLSKSFCSIRKAIKFLALVANSR